MGQSTIPPELFIGSTATLGVMSVVCLVVVVACVRRFGHPAYPAYLPRAVAGGTCLLVLLTTLLLPVDVFLTSLQKYPNGTWREWAADNATRQHIDNTLLYTYYGAYSLLTLSLFILTPFSYFYFEEGESEEGVPRAERLCAALKYSLVFLVLVTGLLLVGAFVQFGELPNNNGTVIDELNFLGDQIKQKGAESALSFTISVLTVAGLIVLALYTSYGLSALPFSFIKTRGSAERELEQLRLGQHRRDEKERQLAAKYADGRPYIPADRRLIVKLARDRERFEEVQRTVESETSSCWSKVKVILRPCNILIGCLLALVSLTFMTSLTVTLVDKLVYSNYTVGYILTKVHYKFSPLNFLLSYAQLVFPLDYVLVLLLVIYIAGCTVNAIRRIGIWFLWIKMFQVVPNRTMPQGLLLLSAVFSCAMISVNQLMMVAMPTYSTYGSQHYQDGNGTAVPCDNAAPPGECPLTQLAALIARFTLQAPFYGATVTFLLAASVLTYVVGFFVALVKRKRSILERATEQGEQEDDPLLNL